MNIFLILILLSSFFSDVKGQVEPSPVHATDVQNAVENAVTYFTKQNDDDFSTMFNYHFLQRKFGIKELYPSKVIFEKLNKYGNMYVFHNVELYRLVDKKFSVPQKKLKEGFNNSMSEMILKALYCDIYNVEANFPEFVFDESKKGGYHLTHALLSVQWLKENSCFPSGDLNVLEAKLIDKHIELINSASDFDDLTIEAIAFVQYAGYHQLIKPEWIKKIIRNQQADGGWKWNSTKDVTDTHPSIVALWSLLEWSNVNNNVSWIEKK